MQFPQPLAPAWARDLIVYEIAPKGFTSPNGPESGTFESLKAKLPYLKKLGVNSIWLTGHSEAPPHVFYNVWSQYANVEPDKIEPTLGTPAQFKDMIATAHKNGIRIFLDVHDHGLHPSSPIVAKHPEWFKGNAGGMIDFDWGGDHKDRDDWWVGVWVDCIKTYNVDGFRIDCGIGKPEVWARIRKEAKAAGYEIAVFEECQFPIRGSSDFGQGPLNSRDIAQDLGGYLSRKYGKSGKYEAVVHYADGTEERGDTEGNGKLVVRMNGFGADKVGHRSDQPGPDGIPDICLTVANVADKKIDDINVNDYWHLHWGSHLAVEGKAPTLTLYLAPLFDGLPSVQFSCHDSGWEGTPENANPYTAQGSRAHFAYSCLLTPMIPIFFAGEEFDAAFHPIPWLSPHYLQGSGDEQQRLKEMYAAGSPSYIAKEEMGKGKWLYGCMLDWTELEKPEHAAMLDDVRRMIAIRKGEKAILTVEPDAQEPKLMSVPFECSESIPVPYIRWSEHGAIVVAANRNAEKEVSVKLDVPLRQMGLAGHTKYRVSDLWLGGRPQTLSAQQLAAFQFQIKRDKTPRGGLRIFKIEPID